MEENPGLEKKSQILYIIILELSSDFWQVVEFLAQVFKNSFWNKFLWENFKSVRHLNTLLTLKTKKKFFQ